MRTFLIWTAAVVLVLGLTSALIYAQAYFEAEAFNRATGSHVSAMDAVFLDLRVQAPPDSARGGR
jgi:hypothetical protein